VGAGQSIAAVAAALGLADQTLHNWLKADREGRLGGPGAMAVTPEQKYRALAQTLREMALLVANMQNIAQSGQQVLHRLTHVEK